MHITFATTYFGTKNVKEGGIGCIKGIDILADFLGIRSGHFYNFNEFE